LSNLNAKVSVIIRQVLLYLLNWRYQLDAKLEDVLFELSEDFDPVPLGEGWLRLVTEWYQQALIPRSVWLSLLKKNDIIRPDYNDRKAAVEIAEDPFIIPSDTEEEPV
jgi:hypothetical protein